MAPLPQALRKVHRGPRDLRLRPVLRRGQGPLETHHGVRQPRMRLPKVATPRMAILTTAHIIVIFLYHRF